MTTPNKKALTHAALAERADLIHRIRNAAGTPFVPLALMVHLAGGTRLASRAARIEAVSQRSLKAGRLSSQDSLALVYLQEDVLKELGFDPRTQLDPLRPRRETVPLASSVRAYLLAGDSDAFLRLVLTANLVPPDEGTG